MSNNRYRYTHLFRRTVHLAIGAYADGDKEYAAPLINAHGFVVSSAKAVKDSGANFYFAIHEQNGQKLIGIRGTEPDKWRDIVADIAVAPINWRGQGRVPAGFVNAMESMYALAKEFVYQDEYKGWKGTQVIIAGHSLGGATALLLGSALAAEFPKASFFVDTIGAPKCGNSDFVSWVETQLPNIHVSRFYHPGDPVVYVPYMGGFYKHVYGYKLPKSDDMFRFGVARAHAGKAYLRTSDYLIKKSPFLNGSIK